MLCLPNFLGHLHLVSVPGSLYSITNSSKISVGYHSKRSFSLTSQYNVHWCWEVGQGLVLLLFVGPGLLPSCVSILLFVLGIWDARHSLRRWRKRVWTIVLGRLLWTNLEMLHSTHILLPKTQTHGDTQLLGRRNVDPLQAQEEEARTSWLSHSEANLLVTGG